MRECHYHLGLSFFIPAPFLLFLRRILLPRVLGNFCLLRREECVAFGLALPFSFLHGMGIVQTRASARIAHWVPIPAISLPSHGLASYVGPLGLLPLSLDFPGPLTSSLPLILPMGLLAVLPAMLVY